MAGETQQFRFWLWLIRLIGLIVPQHLRADWSQEWRAELQWRESQLAHWDRLDFRARLVLLRHSAGGFVDALLLQPRRWEDEMIQDLRYGVRTLRKNPGFTAMAVLSLALGIGANAAIFSLLDAMLLKSLPVKHPEELVFLQSGEPGLKPTSNISHRSFEQLTTQNNYLSGICFFAYPTRFNATIDGQAEAIEGQVVSGDFFHVLGVRPIAGRTLNPQDDRISDVPATAVISHRFWTRRLGSSQNIVGKQLVVNGAPFTVIGIAPPEFFGVMIGNAPDVFLPSAPAERVLPRRFRFRDGSMPRVLARLKPEVSREQSAAALRLVIQRARLSAEPGAPTPEVEREILQAGLTFEPAGRGLSGLRQRYSEPLRILLAAVGLVLLISCANVANLLLARAAARSKENAVRLALGAGRLRLLRQLFTESLLLAGLGGAVGLLLASWSSGLLLNIVSSGRNPVSAGADLALKVPLDGRVLAFTILVSLLAAVVFGLTPALRASRVDLIPALKGTSFGSSGKRRLRMSGVLVISQVALSLMLLIGAGLLTRTIGKLRSADIGFNPERVLLFSIDPQMTGYQVNQIGGLYRDLLTRIGNLPGVQSVSLGRQGLLSGGGTTGSIRIPGHELPTGENEVVRTRNGSEWNAPSLAQVGPRYFETLGMTIIRGRDFTEQDREGSAKVAVVNEAFAKYYFGGEDPISQRIDRGDNGGETEIVGIVRDAKATRIQEATPRTFYVPVFQDQSAWRETTFQLRTSTDPATLSGAVRSAVHEIDPRIAPFRVRTLERQVEESMGQERLVGSLALLFAGLALVLTCAGLYGVLSYAVSQRTHEIGIRMALGSHARAVKWLVIKQGMGMVVIGLAVGAAASYALTRLLRNLLFGVEPYDSVTFITTTLLLAIVALIACWLPAHRASRIDPLTALRTE